MRLLMISGSYPPQACGVGDYTYNLVENLKKNMVEVIVMSEINWGIINYSSIIREISRINPDLIHIQYPTVGYGSSLIPQLISLRYKTIITIHEVSQSHMLRQIALFPFSFRSTIIFTNEFEHSSYKKLNPWYKRKPIVIPIGSNIKVTKKIALQDRNLNNIIYFGQIRPQKGLEDVILFAKLVSDYKLPYQVIITGQLMDKFQDYYKSLKLLDGFDKATWIFDLKEDEIGELLAENLLTYFPFPDGVSERRGSLFASLFNHNLVFSTQGNQTNDDLAKCVTMVSSPKELIDRLINLNTEELLTLAKQKSAYIEQYTQRLQWNTICKDHIFEYNNFIKRK